MYELIARVVRRFKGSGLLITLRFLLCIAGAFMSVPFSFSFRFLCFLSDLVLLDGSSLSLDTA